MIRLQVFCRCCCCCCRSKKKSLNKSFVLQQASQMIKQCYWRERIFSERTRDGRVRVKTRTRVDSSHIFLMTRTRLGLGNWGMLTRLCDSGCWLDCVTRVIHSKNFSFSLIQKITIYKTKFSLIHNLYPNWIHCIRTFFSKAFFHLFIWS